MSFSIIVAADEERGIGRDGKLPWHLPGDMAFYKRTTTAAPAGKQNALIMGRKTFDSIPVKFRPLRQRLNVVLTRSPDYVPEAGVVVAGSLASALALVAERDDIAQTFVIGGGELYAEALQHPSCLRVLLTRVHARFACDTHLLPFEDRFARTHADGPHCDDGVAYTFESYERRAR